MQVKRSCLLLLNSTFKVKDAVEMLVLQPDSNNHQTTSFLSVFSPIYITLAVKRKPLTQYDIDYAPDYRAVDNQERDFFDNLGMSAYAPIIQGTAVIGFVGCGPKQSGAAYYARDLALMETLAHQTGVAISNARLVDDLQHLNKALHSLNRTLRKTNADLERMDAVKTDFVTIASHELRTPLAQIRGYTDIIDALSEQGALDQNQTYTFINNLRKATERVEELIAAMLDVSQIDVNAMELHFTEASPDSLMRMAIEPLNDAMNQRKITLTAHGLKDLPTIHADLQRLVQAFRNLITNAIKFTPDGGKIEINGMFKKADSEAESDHILIEISDTGVGIPTENLELIFDKFFRGFDPALHSTGAYKFLGAGPGLGLTIARGVIEGHDGEIWAESPGQNLETYPGSTFFILLPVQRADDAPHIFSLEDTKIRTPN
jgi:signal transduction histidine kinase